MAASDEDSDGVEEEEDELFTTSMTSQTSGKRERGEEAAADPRFPVGHRSDMRVELVDRYREGRLEPQGGHPGLCVCGNFYDGRPSDYPKRRACKTGGCL